MADNETPSAQRRDTRNNVGNVQQFPRIHPNNVNNFNLYNREGVFMHYLFLNLTMRYTRFFKPVSRRLIEFFTLMNAIGMLSLLVYIHFALVRSTSDCLNHVTDIWPRHGILRAQISRNASLPNYKLYFATEPIDESQLSLQVTGSTMEFKYSAPVRNDHLANLKHWQHDIFQKYPFAIQGLKNQTMKVTPNTAKIQALRMFGLFEKKCPVLVDTYIEDFKLSMMAKMAAVLPHLTMKYSDKNKESFKEDEILAEEHFENIFSPFEPSPIRSYYAIEYSSEFGYLRLSSEARSVLSIPTLVVNLNPDKEQCFGTGLKKFMLDTFLGYDDFLMTSIKKLAERDNSQGYLRNLVTGEYFRFVTLWVNHASVIIALSAMIVFTLIVTMLLRYSYHQIFMFMVEVLRLLDTDTRLAFPAAPMLTIILALVGMEEIMTEFFHDSTVAFYVILIIWAADQFDVVCLHTVIGRRYWVRFFYLYHFSFYVYHYRFNGQYSKLALFTSWLLILHSMLYFLHHYELPAIHRQIVVINERNRQNQANNQSPGNGGNNGETAPHNGDENLQTRSQEPDASATPPSDEPQPPANTQEPGGLDISEIIGLDLSENSLSEKNFCIEQDLYTYSQFVNSPNYLMHYFSEISVFGKYVFKVGMACILCIVAAVLMALTVHNNLSPGLYLKPLDVKALF